MLKNSWRNFNDDPIETYSSRLWLGTVHLNDSVMIHYKLKMDFNIILDPKKGNIQCFFQAKFPPYKDYKISIRLRDIAVILNTAYRPLLFILRYPPHILEQEGELWNRSYDFTTMGKLRHDGYFGFCNVLSWDLDTFNQQEFKNMFGKFGIFPIRKDVEIVETSTKPLNPCHQGLHEDVLFKLETAISSNHFNKWQLNETFYENLRSYPPHVGTKVVDELSEDRSLLLKLCNSLSNQRNIYLNRIFNFNCLEELEQAANRVSLSSKESEKDEDEDFVLKNDPMDIAVYVKTVNVTPTRIIPRGPFKDCSNRIIRNFDPTLFVRLTFTEENLRPLYSVHFKGSFLERVKYKLSRYIKIAGEKYIFFACSASQLRTRGCWLIKMNAPIGSRRSDIWRWMGDFSDIKSPSKFLARLGQSLSTTIKVSETFGSEAYEIDDIEHNGYCFSDGIGKISLEYANVVFDELKKRSGIENKETPSAFQIRYAGIKGMVAVDLSLTGMKLAYRKSMKKFHSNIQHLEIIRYSKYSPAYLNRQMITILSSLGVSNRVFYEFYDKTFEDIQNFTNNLDKSKLILYEIPYASSMVEAGFNTVDAFLNSLLQTVKMKMTMTLRDKTKLYVEKGRYSIGILDESMTLQYGQVFLRIVDPVTNEKHVITGKVVVCKNPCLHPGDIRVLECVDIPHLHHLVDCLVFPAVGERPHPNELSGSDLDGDIYFVSWDEKLLFPVNQPAAEYEPLVSPSVDKVEAKDLVDFYVTYISNDCLGPIATCHLAHANRTDNELGALSPECLTLSRLHSIAVDFAKHGTVTAIPPKLRTAFPKFMCRKGTTSFAPCNSILAKLYEKSRNLSVEDFQIDLIVDKHLIVEGYDAYLSPMKSLFHRYNKELIGLMRRYNIKTEAEIASRYIMKIEKDQSESKFIKNMPWIEQSYLSLQKAYKLLTANIPKPEGSNHNVETRKKASAAYYITYTQESTPPLLSFAWIHLETLCAIKKDSMNGKEPLYTNIRGMTEELVAKKIK